MIKSIKISYCTIFFVIFILISSSNYSFSQPMEYSSFDILFVGGYGLNNFSSIQNAIENSSGGQTIYVYNGTYYENIVIDKRIDLIGEDRNNTIIDGSNKGNTVEIKAEGVSFSNFTVVNGDLAEPKLPSDYFKAGIRVEKSKCVIEHNIIKDNREGILGLRVKNLKILNNTFYNDGITFSPYENIKRPVIKKEYFIHTIKNNTVNDKQLFYLKNVNDIDITGKIGQLIAVNCSGLNISVSISNLSSSGLIMAYCSFCKIKKTKITQNNGIWTFKSDNNLFEFNNLSCNYLHGITLDYRSNNNIIKNNDIRNNNMAGVMLEYFSKHNLIKSNNLIDNKKYNGCFIQAFRNRWVQNYWSDWVGLQKSSMKFFPKIIKGVPIEKINIFLWINFDFKPAENPYNFEISNNTLYVDKSGKADFTKIQDAIDYAKPGDTIYVCNGTYYEDVLVDKSLKLVGDHRDNTIINAGDKGNAILLTADNCYVSNFTLCNNKTGYERKDLDIFYNTGIKVRSDDNIIINLKCINTNFAMWFINSNNNKILNNHLEGFWDGIALDYSENNFLRNNSMYGSGILTEDKNNIDESNLINNRNIYYYYNQSNIEVPEEAGQVILVKCNNFIVENLSIYNTTLGISIFDSDNNIIRNNSVYNTTDFGILMNNSDGNIIYNNHINDNPFGLALSPGGTKNYKFCSKNENNMIFSNNFSNNMVGIAITKTNNNDIFENNFISNFKHVEIVISFKNNFSKNYWDDWKGLKLDICKHFPKIIPVIFTYNKILSSLPVDVRRVPIGFVFDKNPSDEPYKNM